MPIFDIFSRRKQPAPKVLTFDEIPHPLRIQLLSAMDDARILIEDRTTPGYRALGTEGHDCFAEACLILRRELGLGILIKQERRSRNLGDDTAFIADEFIKFFQHCETENVLDGVEVVMSLIQNASRLLDHKCNHSTVAAEINTRFQQHGVGFQYESGQIIMASNQALHVETTVPALHLLSDPTYQGANEEFLRAHEHFRYGRYHDCLNDCLKAFESTMKIICDRKRWPYKQTDTAKVLIKICLDNGLVATFSQQQLTSVRTLLESGIPTVRNKRSGHGQGVEKNEVPKHLAQYALHLTAATVLLLVESV